MISITPHPAGFLKDSWIDLIRKEADRATEMGRLTDRQLRLFYGQGWFKALVPKVYGGLQWSFNEIVRFEEAIGWTDGSAGWVFTLCSGAGWFGGYLDQAFAKRIFKPENACLAGSGAIGGLAAPGDGKTAPVVSGRWNYATGAPHATAFTANVYLEEGNERKGGTVRACLFLPGEVTVEKTWHPVGLIASASESFSVDHIAAPPQRWFDIDPDKPAIAEALYRLPFGALAEATIAANLSGMALHFMEEAAVLWEQKKQYGSGAAQVPKWMSAAERLLHDYCGKWTAARSKLWQAADKLESFVQDHMAAPDLAGHKDYQRRSQAVCDAAQRQAALCRQIVNGLYPYTGLTGAGSRSAIGKVWRDFQTGSQHALFVPVI